jgi:hypothetical protein
VQMPKFTPSGFVTDNDYLPLAPTIILGYRWQSIDHFCMTFKRENFDR